jgi:hypothetical protein
MPIAIVTIMVHLLLNGGCPANSFARTCFCGTPDASALAASLSSFCFMTMVSGSVLAVGSLLCLCIRPFAIGVGALHVVNSWKFNPQRKQRKPRLQFVGSISPNTPASRSVSISVGLTSGNASAKLIVLACLAYTTLLPHTRQ